MAHLGENAGRAPRRWWSRRFRPRNPLIRLLWRIFVALVGTVVILTGIALLVLPGPGWVIIFAGLGILATEFTWASRAIVYTRDKLAAWTRWVARAGWRAKILVTGAMVAGGVFALVAYDLIVGLPGWAPEWVSLIEAGPLLG